MRSIRGCHLTNYIIHSILFTSFHNHAQLSDLEQALLRLMIMMPIATMTGESLTNVHTSWTQTQMRPESITDKRDPIR